jgi:circadian clock protein KaiC
MKVSLFIITETSHVIESTAMSDIGVSYFSDNIIFLRYLEYRGELRKVIGVLKKRSGDFEKTLRLFEITAHGVKVGKPLKNLRGILTGIPEILSNIPDDEIL